MYTLFVARGYPTDKYKTYGIFEFDQAKALAKEGVKVVYAALDYRSIRRWRKWGIQRIKKDGIDVYSINIPIGNIPRDILRVFTVRGLKRLYRKIEKDQGKPDIIHAHFINSAYSSSYLKDDIGVPLVITEHSSQVNKSNIEKSLFKASDFAYKKADRVIGVSKSLKDKIKDNFNIDATYIPNIADLDIFKYKEKISDSNFTIVSTGNLIKLKGMDLLIKSFYKVFKDNESVKLKIFGQGTEKDNLKELIKTFNLENQIQLMGLCSREEIAETLSKSDLFVLPSKSETFGVAFIEALAMGVPVIATRCGGPEGFVNESNGLLVDVGDEEALEDALAYMHDNIEEYKRESIAQETRKLFSAEVVANKIIDVYKELL